MIIVLLTWLWICISSFCFGLLAEKVFSMIVSRNIGIKTHRLLLLGLMLLTVFSEFFSLFYKVGLVANIVLLVINIAVIISFRGIIRKTVYELISSCSVYEGIVIAGLLLLVAARSSMYINAGDTYLYHAQAIHWISEYGVVRGLGNLHTRFAFNSAFLCLQALFSFSFFPGGVSYHTVNGFLMVVFLSYAVLSMKFWKNAKVYVSDGMKIAMIMYCAKNADQFSAPGTDLFALCLAIYIICEWIALSEAGRKDLPAYAELCVFIVFDISLKLSTAMLLGLVLYPAVMLVKQKQWKYIFSYLFVGTVVIFPFLARNVIISGWLIYPFSAIDLFNVDWKIPAETLKAECIRTLLGSRGVYGILTTEATLNQWLPYWLAENGKSVLVYLLADVVSVPVLICVGLIQLKREKNASVLHMTFVLLASVVYWWVSAPSVRYGKPFLLLIPLMCMGCVGSKISIPHAERALPCMITVVCTLYFSYIATCSEILTEYIIHPADYYDWKGIENDVDGEQIYSPAYRDYISYYYFPETNDVNILEKIELRGESLGAGFRVKEGVRYLF